MQSATNCSALIGSAVHRGPAIWRINAALNPQGAELVKSIPPNPLNLETYGANCKYIINQNARIKFITSRKIVPSLMTALTLLECCIWHVHSQFQPVKACKLQE
jgi:hypothetical protein